MAKDQLDVDRLRAALQAARGRITKNAKHRLFQSSSTKALTIEDRNGRRAIALALAEELGQLAEGDLETLRFAQLNAIYGRLQSTGLILSGPEMIELNIAFFATRLAFGV